MDQSSPLAISISRLRGCGGAYLGQRIAGALGISYLDRELVSEIANKLELPIEVVEAHDERADSYWISLLESLSIANPWLFNPPPITSAGEQVRQLETEIIAKVAKERSVVVVGRGSSYFLRHHPRHVSIFLHANKQFRVKRLQDVYGVSHQEAVSVIEKTDKERAQLKKALTGIDMLDAAQYHLCLDTGILGMEKTEEMILQYVKLRFGV